MVPFLRHRRIPEKPTKATPVHPPPAISTLKGPPMRPSQAPSASSSRQNFVVVRNKGLKSKIPVSAGFLAVQGRLLSGKFPRKRPEIRLFHRADASQGCALACIQRAGRTVTIVARTVGSKVASLGVDLPCRERGSTFEFALHLSTFLPGRVQGCSSTELRRSEAP